MTNTKSNKFCKYFGYTFIVFSLLGIIATITTSKNYILDIIEYLSIGLCLVFNSNEKKNNSYIYALFAIFFITCIIKGLKSIF